MEERKGEERKRIRYDPAHGMHTNKRPFKQCTSRRDEPPRDLRIPPLEGYPGGSRLLNAPQLGLETSIPQRLDQQRRVNPSPQVARVQVSTHRPSEIRT